MAERSDVLRSYANFVAKLWEDETVLPSLQANPHEVLTGYGFDIPADAEINLILREVNTDGAPETQLDLIEQGATTGKFDFIVPLQPDGMELQDIPLSEEMLDLVAGGQAAMAGCCPCCCCCPCCGGGSEIQ